MATTPSIPRRAADEIALAAVASEIGQAVELGAGLDPFRGHLQAEGMREGDRGRHDRLVRTEAAQAGDRAGDPPGRRSVDRPHDEADELVSTGASRDLHAGRRGNALPDAFEGGRRRRGGPACR
jgi:hypothetical protein